MVNIWLYSLSLLTLRPYPHLYYRESYWSKNRKYIKKRARRKKIAQKLKEDCSHLYILIMILLIILNLVIYNYKLYFDVAEEVLIY